MKKYLLLSLLLVIPAPAIAETYNGVQLPANFMIWRGKVYNLDYSAQFSDWVRIGTGEIFVKQDNLT